MDFNFFYFLKHKVRKSGGYFLLLAFLVTLVGIRLGIGTLFRDQTGFPNTDIYLHRHILGLKSSQILEVVTILASSSYIRFLSLSLLFVAFQVNIQPCLATSSEFLISRYGSGQANPPTSNNLRLRWTTSPKSSASNFTCLR